MVGTLEVFGAREEMSLHEEEGGREGRPCYDGSSQLAPPSENHKQEQSGLSENQTHQHTMDHQQGFHWETCWN